MASLDPDVFQESQRSNWVRLRTLVIVRWIAIFGQIVAILAAWLMYALQFEIALALATVGLSILANVGCTLLNPGNRRLSEREATLMLVFDILQLGLLLYITGGLNNPFALLLLAPVTIAATVLHMRSTVFLGAVTILCISAIALWSLPILSNTDEQLLLPDLFKFGYWIALITGVLFLAVYARQVTTEMHAMGEALVATQLALAREQKLTDLGGVVAATAHELGTPLATIKLVSAELMDELSHSPDLYEDASLIRAQADRCRDILQSMGQIGKDDLLMRSAPIETVVREAAEPHVGRGKDVRFVVAPADDHDPRQPVVDRRPEIIHGLRNLIQNAVDFSASRVTVASSWTDSSIIVRIEDDGRGFPQSVISRIGDPFVRSRRAEAEKRPGYEGMGLGLFIAKTLLERSGARLNFANDGTRSDQGGAIVIVEWPRQTIERMQDEVLGQNQPIEV